MFNNIVWSQIVFSLILIFTTEKCKMIGRFQFQNI